MILHTILPPKAIFQEYYFQQTPGQELVMSYQGIPVIVEVGNNELTIKQILSTDPQHFLNEEVAPGTKITI